MDKSVQKVTISLPYKYSAWPMLGVTNGKLVCIYTVANRHSATETELFMKTSDDGISWAEEKPVLIGDNIIKGITGTGNDSLGNMLFWYRNGAPGLPSTTHELYKTDGEITARVCKLDYPLGGAHIGNIFWVGESLFSFYNTYGPKRTWGVLKSTDDGATWENMPIESIIDKSECPVEIEGVYIRGGKILALGRKDSPDGTIAMFQIQSSDSGKSWTKEYTNITDAMWNSPSLILNRETQMLFLYYFDRGAGVFKRRVMNVADVWSYPLGWCDYEVLVTEDSKGEDTGNVRLVTFKDLHYATYYAGTPDLTGIYGIAIKE